MKKIISVFLAVLMVFVIMPVEVFAENDFPGYDYSEKAIAFYGDSIVAQTNGNWEYPFTSFNWASLIGQYFNFKKIYSRGIGGQTYRWSNGGGSVSFVDENTGELISRIDGTSYDDYTGEIEKGQIKTRGCGSSYHRIASMFPETIREEIDYVFVIFHNDASYGTALDSETAVWESGSAADPEWYLSEYYEEFGGDYNISTTAGAIASTVMKLRTVLPNAEIILGTPVSGRGSSGKINPTMTDSASYGTLALRNLIIKSSEIFSVSCVDVYKTCGINGLNRTEYISDGIHPNRFGQEMLARGVIQGLKKLENPELVKSDWQEKNIVVYSNSDNNTFYLYDSLISDFEKYSPEDIDCIIFSPDNLPYLPGTINWNSQSSSDSSWFESEYYQNYCGDYDFSTTSGRIASVILKLQAAFPNSVLVFDTQNLIETNLLETVLQTALNFSIPYINGYNPDNLQEDLTFIIPKFSKTSFGETTSGTTSFAHSTVSVLSQGIYGFEAGETYRYTLNPDYDGKISMYYAYKNTSKNTCFDVILNPMALSPVNCSSNSEITGFFTLPGTNDADNRPVEFIVIRTYTSNKVSIDYTFTKIPKNLSLGDTNLDGSVDIKDVYTARLIAAKLIKPTNQQVAVGDLDLDGKITAIDANIIRKFIAGIIKEIPIE